MPASSSRPRRTPAGGAQQHHGYCSPPTSLTRGAHAARRSPSGQPTSTQPKRSPGHAIGRAHCCLCSPTVLPESARQAARARSHWAIWWVGAVGAGAHGMFINLPCAAACGPLGLQHAAPRGTQRQLDNGAALTCQRRSHYAAWSPSSTFEQRTPALRPFDVANCKFATHRPARCCAAAKHCLQQRWWAGAAGRRHPPVGTPVRRAVALRWGQQCSSWPALHGCCPGLLKPRSAAAVAAPGGRAAPVGCRCRLAFRRPPGQAPPSGRPAASAPPWCGRLRSASTRSAQDPGSQPRSGQPLVIWHASAAQHLPDAAHGRRSAAAAAGRAPPTARPSPTAAALPRSMHVTAWHWAALDACAGLTPAATCAAAEPSLGCWGGCR